MIKKPIPRTLSTTMWEGMYCAALHAARIPATRILARTKTKDSSGDSRRERFPAAANLHRDVGAKDVLNRCLFQDCHRSVDSGVSAIPSARREEKHEVTSMAVSTTLKPRPCRDTRVLC